MSSEERQRQAEFIPNSLQLSFSTTMIFEHHVVSNWLSLSNARQSKGSQKHIDDLWKTLQARLVILPLFMWLNLVTSTKLLTYPGEGSSHYVVQLFFFFDDFFFSAWLNFAKDTKLPTYPWKGSSHYVVQKIFFFLMFFFLCFYKKEGPMCSNGYHH